RYCDVLRLAEMTRSPGLVIDGLVAGGIAHEGLSRLGGLLPQLEATELDSVCKTIEGFGEHPEPIEVVFARDRRCQQDEIGSTTRLSYLLEGLLGENSTEVLVRGARNRIDALQNLILAEAAVRRHILLEGSPPDSLAALVPKYLSAVPRDPFGVGPLVY